MSSINFFCCLETRDELWFFQLKILLLLGDILIQMEVMSYLGFELKRKISVNTSSDYGLELWSPSALPSQNNVHILYISMILTQFHLSLHMESQLSLPMDLLVHLGRLQSSVRKQRLGAIIYYLERSPVCLKIVSNCKKKNSNYDLCTLTFRKNTGKTLMQFLSCELYISSKVKDKRKHRRDKTYQKKEKRRKK